MPQGRCLDHDHTTTGSTIILAELVQFDTVKVLNSIALGPILLCTTSRQDSYKECLNESSCCTAKQMVGLIKTVYTWYNNMLYPCASPEQRIDMCYCLLVIACCLLRQVQQWSCAPSVSHTQHIKGHAAAEQQGVYGAEQHGLSVA